MTIVVLSYFVFQLVAIMEVEVNSSGHIIHSKGSIPEITDWLSFRFDFRFFYCTENV